MWPEARLVTGTFDHRKKFPISGNSASKGHAKNGNGCPRNNLRGQRAVPVPGARSPHPPGIGRPEEEAPASNGRGAGGCHRAQHFGPQCRTLRAQGMSANRSCSGIPPRNRWERTRPPNDGCRARARTTSLRHRDTPSTGWPGSGRVHPRSRVGTRIPKEVVLGRSKKQKRLTTHTPSEGRGLFLLAMETNSIGPATHRSA